MSFKPTTTAETEALRGKTGWHYSITRNARYAPHVDSWHGPAGET
ncbi:MAG: hypothetical protein ACRDP3_06460 [Streptomyces sp.]